jgi:hypothetical protein
MESAVEKTSPTTPQPPTPEAPGASGPTDDDAAAPAGFAARGRMRRRARFLRKARELAYRDLGGLVFSLHRFGRRNDALVLAKLSTLGQIDAELRALESALDERQPLTVLREAGITACPRCAAIHGSEDRFCPSCGLPMSRRVDLPIAGPPGAATTPSPGASPAGAGGGDRADAATPPAATPPAPASTRSPATTPAPSPASTPERSSAPRAPAPPEGTTATPGTARPASAPESGPAATSASPGTAAQEGSPSQPAPPDAGPAPDHADGEEPTEVMRPRSGSA